MRILSELRTCCGGATMTKPEPELSRTMCNRVVSQGGKLRKKENWKPVLHAISEDKAIADIDRYGSIEKAVRNSGNKRPSNDCVKSGRAPKRFGDGYWKMSYAVAVPAFSGALF